MTVGDRIKHARLSAGMKQVELAERAGISRQNLSKYEGNIIRNIPLEAIENIARVLDVKPGYLAGFASPNEQIVTTPDMSKNFDLERYLSDALVYLRSADSVQYMGTPVDKHMLPILRKCIETQLQLMDTITRQNRE